MFNPLFHLARCLAVIGLALPVMATLGALSGCGGGDPLVDDEDVWCVLHRPSFDNGREHAMWRQRCRMQPGDPRCAEHPERCA